MSMQSAVRAAGWRTPAVVVVCGCLIAMISFGPRSALGLFLTPMPQEHHASGAPAPVAAAPAPAPAAPVAARASVPQVQPFRLPVDDLKSVAEGSGLQWVLSDADKIAAAQAAMAAEPKPVHVPRERRPVVVVDEGPLVLVETKKDLRNLPLPF